MSKYGLPLNVIIKLLGREDNITVYERKNGITCIGSTLVGNFGDIRFYRINKSDNSDTLTIVYRTGVKSDSWLMWRPTDNQVQILNLHFADIFRAVKQYNQNHKIRPKEELFDE